MDLPRQRPRRDRDHRSRAVADLRGPGRRRGSPHRPAGCRPRHRRPRLVRLRDVGGAGCGWTSGQTILFTAAAIVLIAAFFLLERRHESPLVPFSIFRLRPVTVANAVGALLGGALRRFFLLTLYMQGVLGCSRSRPGGVPGHRRNNDSRSSRRPGPCNALGREARDDDGPLPVGVRLRLVHAAPPDGTFWANLFVPYVASGIGIPFVFIPLSLAALSVVEGPNRGHLVGPAQHVTADRRCTRRGDHGHDLDHPLRDVAEGRGPRPRRSRRATTGRFGSPRASCCSAP